MLVMRACDVVSEQTHRSTSQRAPCRQLLRDPEVMFAGYKFPHPLEYHIFIKVQTMGKKPPREAFDDALTNLIGELNDIRDKFRVRQASFTIDVLFECSMTRITCKSACAAVLRWPHASDDSPLSFLCRACLGADLQAAIYLTVAQRLVTPTKACAVCVSF